MPRARTRSTSEVVDLTTLRTCVAEHMGTHVKVYGTADAAVQCIANPGATLMHTIPLLNAQFGLDVSALAGRPSYLVFLNYDPAMIPDSWPQKRTNIRQLFRPREA